MKIVFLGILVFHGLIHLLGFAKAFHLAEIVQLTQNIPKVHGIIWLTTTILFLLIAVLFLFNIEWWWAPGFVAVILSQWLILLSWQDAKFGTIPNLFILVGVIIGFSLWNFNGQINRETQELLSTPTPEEQRITEDMTIHLPTPVRRWLTESGIIGKESIHKVHLRQKGFMKLKPEQKNWIEAEAEQSFTIDRPSFIWRVKTSMAGLPVVGRDRFSEGEGGMQIKLAGLIPVVNVSNDKKLNESTIQRYLGEIIWFPSAALSPYISWEAVDNNSAKATMRIGNNEGSALFHFNAAGELERFTAQRYKDIRDEKPTEWVAEVKGYGTVAGIKIPVRIETSWILEEGIFTWYKFDVFDVKYNDAVYER